MRSITRDEMLCSARIGFDEDIARLMQMRGMRPVDLARSAGVTQAYVSGVLDGSRKLSLRGMVRLALAVGGFVEVRVCDGDKEVTRVLDIPTAREIDDRLAPVAPAPAEEVTP